MEVGRFQATDINGAAGAPNDGTAMFPNEKRQAPNGTGLRRRASPERLIGIH